MAEPSEMAQSDNYDTQGDRSLTDEVLGLQPYMFEPVHSESVTATSIDEDNSSDSSQELEGAMTMVDLGGRLGNREWCDAIINHLNSDPISKNTIPDVAHVGSNDNTDPSHEQKREVKPGVRERVSASCPTCCTRRLSTSNQANGQIKVQTNSI